MALTNVLLLALGFLGLGIISFFVARVFRLTTAQLPPKLEHFASEPACCGACTHFSLEAGQQELHRNPSFAVAMQLLPPWRMGQKREFEWHPDFAPLDAALQEAISARDQARVLEIQKQIDELPLESFGREKNPTEYIQPEALATRWQDFGACAKHHELRVQSDCCGQFVPASQVRPRR